MTDPDRTTIRELRKTRLLAVLMLAVSPLVYLAFAALLDITEKIGGEYQLMLYILLIVALVEPVLVPLLRKLQINSYRKRKSSRATPAQLLLVLQLIAFSFVHAIYIYGFVLYLISGSFLDLFLFSIIGGVWSAIYWPREGAMKKLIRSIEAA